ncbi:MAG: hypothetical protein WC718_03880 [Phycisphaerales bacterium]|jgi:hypothetical protein
MYVLLTAIKDTTIGTASLDVTYPRPDEVEKPLPSMAVTDVTRPLPQSRTEMVVTLPPCEA